MKKECSNIMWLGFFGIGCRLCSYGKKGNENSLRLYI